MTEIKKCTNSNCEDPYKPATKENYYETNAYNKELGNHKKLVSECKVCSRKRALRDRHIDLEKTRERDRRQYYKRRKTELPRMRQDYYDRKELRKETLKRWYEANPEKRKEYGNNHQNHEISEHEWFSCLDYFDWSCAYCGYTLEQHLIEVGQSLHKDHINHDGNNFIDNCAPACRRCNSSKHDSTIIDWYNKDNPYFKKKRLNKIVKWSISDWEKYT